MRVAAVQIGVPGGRQLITVTPFDAAPAEDRSPALPRLGQEERDEQLDAIDVAARA